MDSQIKKMPVSESVKNKESQTCSCKSLSRKVNELQDTVNTLAKTVDKQNDAIMSVLAEIKVIVSKLVRQEATVTAATTGFPISTNEMLQQIEDNINADNIIIYVNTMSKLWRNNISKNLEQIFHPDMVMAYNIDGTHGKLRLKDFKQFYTALIDSIASLACAANQDPEQLLRQVMQLNKKKQFRQQAINKKLTKAIPKQLQL